MRRIRIRLGDGQEAFAPLADSNPELVFLMANGRRLRVKPRFPIATVALPGVISMPRAIYTHTVPVPGVTLRRGTVTVPVTPHTLTLPVPAVDFGISEAPAISTAAEYTENQVRIGVTLFGATTYTPTVTLNGAPVAFTYIDPFLLGVTVPLSATAQTVAWTVSATNSVGTTVATGSFVVPAGLSVPAAPAPGDWSLAEFLDVPSAPSDSDWTLLGNDAPVATVPDAPGTGDWSIAEVTVDPPPPPPSGGLTAPTAVTATTVDDRTITVTWTNGGGSPTSHDVQWSTDQSTWTTSAGRTSPASMTGLPVGGARYWFRVIARNASNSATSATANATTHLRHYGLTAEWNLPIAGAVAARGTHPNETYIRDVLFFAHQNPGWLNMFDRDYTYPVYLSSQATTVATVAVTFGNWRDRQIPWNPNWVIPSGTDNQIILLNETTGEEFNAWGIRYDAATNRIVPSSSAGARFSRVTAATDGDASALPGDYRTKTNGFVPSRGCGVQYLAFLIRPQEIAQGKIYHAVGCVMRRSGFAYHARPAYKSERFPGNDANLGVPQGTRFWLDVTDGEIDAHLASWPSVVPTATRDSMRIVFRAMRDYGIVANDQGGGNHVQFEHTASAAWAPYGLAQEYVASNGRSYPRDAIDNLLSSSSRIRVVRPPDDVMYYARWSGETNRAPTPLIGTFSSQGVPQISGTTTVGSTLSVTRAGQFMGEHPVTITRQWRRGSTDIAGATGTTYTVQTADRGFEVYCRFIGTNGNGSNNHDSNRIFIP